MTQVVACADRIALLQLLLILLFHLYLPLLLAVSTDGRFTLHIPFNSPCSGSDVSEKCSICQLTMPTTFLSASVSITAY